MPLSIDKDSKGFALIAALLMLLLLSAISIGLIFTVNNETATHTVDLNSTSAYYGAEAGMEKMMADLSNLYISVQSPSVSQIRNLGNNPPTLTNFSFPEYAFTVPASGSTPIYQTRTITSGPNLGLHAQILSITLAVTAQKFGTEVRMTRRIEVALIPVFQYGIFSDTDLSFFAGANFDFGGRIHTNGNLYLASDSGTNLILHDKVTAAGEVIRTVQSNGLSNTGFQEGTVYVSTQSTGCDANQNLPNCRPLGFKPTNEGSMSVWPTASIETNRNPNWVNISTITYNSRIVNGLTGARRLTLPFVQGTTRPIELIRRPRTGEDPNSALGKSREYNLAQIRVLFSDYRSELPGGDADAPNNIELSNVVSGTTDYSTGVPVAGANPTYFGEALSRTDITSDQFDKDWIPRVDASVRSATDTITPLNFKRWPLVGGFMRVEYRDSGGSYQPCTREWLELGFARGLATPNSESGIVNSVHPNAILILQTLADRDGDNALTYSNTSPTTKPHPYIYADESSGFIGAAYRYNFFPINFYDTREGEYRAGGTATTCPIGGVMNGVELDVRNLRRWLLGQIGASGTSVENATQNGYILYFSDRRGMLSPDAGNRLLGEKYGEYGFEDNINPNVSNGIPNGVLDAPEDVNQNGVLDTYGDMNLGDAFDIAAQGASYPTYVAGKDDPKTRIDPLIARKNRVSGARHSFRLINGSLGNLPSRSDGTGGFTVASENPVYLQGNYNARTSAGWGDVVGATHVPASIIADAVSIQSSNWSDVTSFNSPTNSGARSAATTWQRVAIAGGKNISFPQPSWDTSTDIGLDGGMHNFLRYMENWGGQNHYYKGSLVSLYYACYNNSIYNNLINAYGPPTRVYSFDTDYNDPNKMPPGTPRFEDVVNLGFAQDFTAGH